MLYHPNWPHNYDDFLKQRKSLQPHIDNMVENMYFSCAIVKNATSEKLRRIEAILVNKIGMNKLINDRTAKDSRLDIRNIGSADIINLFDLSKQVGFGIRGEGN